ncbi:MAG: tetratricopeptide repeat protein [Proteobacteria bacterium]|nr:tetratricopeptide repeat protein [Pseudomonadota bacterium]
MLGLSRSVILGLIGAGFVTPARGPRNEYRFSFRDVVLLRTAHGLRAANIPPRRMLNSLRRLRARLPDEVPLSGLRIQAIGNDVAVRDGDAPWDAGSGQLLMDFEVATASSGAVAFLSRAPSRPPAAAKTAADWFGVGERLDADGDAPGAEAAYRAALALAPDHVYAHVNLGALLCDAGRAAEATALYDVALVRCEESPLLHFNAAIALEDQGRDADALAHYERCYALAPDLADAHYNAARLLEKRGDTQAALRHYSAYRRLQP